MSSTITLAQGVAAAAAASIVYAVFAARKKPSAPLPPGPPPKFLLGNMADMPTEQEWKTFTRWAEEYGDIVSVNVLGQTIVILNTEQLAVEILERKSAIYSDRPSFKMGGEICGWEKALGMSHYGDRFREYRKLFHRVLGTKERITKLYPVAEQETRAFLRSVLKTPDDFGMHIRNTAGRIILDIIYGYKVSGDDDRIVATVNQGMHIFSESTKPGAFMVDVLPWLEYVPEWFPGTGWKQTAKAWKKCVTDMADLPFDFVQKQLSSGTARPSFTADMLESKPDVEREDVIKWASASMYAGGADTTVSAINTFFLAMTLYPEAQKKAQAEIDAVIGQGRLPTFNDRESLPYVCALVQEVLRWQPVTPFGLPHRSLQDDVHNGYFIPKGSMIFANVWLHLHDPKTYMDPLEFRPERFLGPTPEKDPRGMCFGFGRRICPGIQLADASVYLSCVQSLAALSIAPHPSGPPPVPEYTSGTVSRPVPFRCSIVPRSPQMEALVKAA